jgi:hypothetical protein
MLYCSFSNISVKSAAKQANWDRHKNLQLIALVLLLVWHFVCFPSHALAGQFRDTREAQAAANNGEPVGRTLNVDLTSTAAIVQASELANIAGVTIQVGNLTRTIAQTDLLTAAEAIAAHQVVTTGQQFLLLSAEGSANGGSFDLHLFANDNLQNLVIPQGVTCTQNFSKSDPLNISGGLTNYGTLNFTTQGRANIAAVIAEDILNQSGATISARANLHLTATNSLTNLGLITSTGNLTLNSSNITNQGIISGGENILVQNLTSSGIQAFGGTWSAPQINFFAPIGAVNVDAEIINGLVSVKALAAQVTADASNLTIANIDVSGDPLFTSAGDLTLVANITAAGQPFTAIAAGNIIGAAKTGTVISTASGGGGGDVILLAGAANQTVDGITTVTGASGLTGNISGIKSINASGTGGGSAGDVILATFGGTITVIGDINVNSTANTAGNILVLSPDNITINNLNSQGTHGGTPAIVIRNASPAIVDTLTFNAAGGLLTGEITTGAASTQASASVTAGNLSTASSFAAGGDVLITANNGVTVTSIKTLGANMRKFSNGVNGLPGGAVQIENLNSQVTIKGLIDTSGGGGAAGAWASSQDGGDGANAGNISITSIGQIVTQAILAVGGGGGGGAGSSVVGTDAGDGGDGGAGGIINIVSSAGITVGALSAGAGNGGGGGGGCCEGGTGGFGGTGATGQPGIRALAKGLLLGTFPYGTLPGGFYYGPGGGTAGQGKYGGGGGPGGWWGFEYGGTGGTGGSAGAITVTAVQNVVTADLSAIGGGAGGGGGMTAQGGGGSSGASGGRAEDLIKVGDGTPGGAAGRYSGGGGGQWHQAGAAGGIFGGRGGNSEVDGNGGNGGPSGGGGGGGWTKGGLGGGSGPTGFGGNITITSSEGAISTTGNIETFSFTKAAGNISLTAKTDIAITGSVRSDSGTESGETSISTETGSIAIGKNIDASSGGTGNGNNISLFAHQGTIAVGAPANTLGINAVGSINTSSVGAAAGEVLIEGGGMVSVSDSIITRSGKLSIGSGGAVSISTTELEDSPIAAHIGRAIIGGYIDSRGGDFVDGQTGGSVSIISGTLQILGAITGASIITSGSNGAEAGSVNIQTFGIQSVPSAFDLTSTQASEMALPGGLFSVGNSTINGTAANIVSGDTVASLQNAASIIESTPLNLADDTIVIQTTGSSFTINQDGIDTEISVVDEFGNHSMVTPAQAIALYQLSHDQLQTIGLNALGQATNTNPNTGLGPSLIAIPEFELPKQFTSFNLQSASLDGGIELNISGITPKLVMPTALPATIAGFINFTSDNSSAQILFNAQPLSIASTGGITGTSTTVLTLSGSNANWNNEGVIQSGSLVIQSSANLFTLNLGASGLIVGPSELDQGSVQFLAQALIINGGTFEAITVNATVNKVSIASKFAEAAALGNIAATAISVTANQINIAPGSTLITQAQVVSTGRRAGQSVGAIAGITLHATSDAIDIGRDSQLIAINGAVQLLADQGSIEIGKHVLIQAGSLSASATPQGLITTKFLATSGQVTITSGSSTGILIDSAAGADQTSIISNGQDMLLVALNGGGIAFGDSAILKVNGGNLVALASGEISGNQTNFSARALSKAGMKTGGGIEIGSGLTTSANIINYYRTRPPFKTFTLSPNPLPDIGTNVTINNNAINQGMVQVNIIGGGTVAISDSTISLKRGIVVFDATGANAAIEINAATFSTEANPISYQSQSTSDGEYLVDTSDFDLDD